MSSSANENPNTGAASSSDTARFSSKTAEDEPTTPDRPQNTVSTSVPAKPDAPIIIESLFRLLRTFATPATLQAHYEDMQELFFLMMETHTSGLSIAQQRKLSSAFVTDKSIDYVRDGQVGNLIATIELQNQQVEIQKQEISHHIRQIKKQEETIEILCRGARERVQDRHYLRAERDSVREENIALRKELKGLYDLMGDGGDGKE